MKQVPSIISTPPLDELADELGPDGAAEPTDASEVRSFTIPVAQHGERLDRVLAEVIPEFSRNYLRQLIEAGAVTLRGAAVRKPATTVRAGEPGQIELHPTPQSQAFRPEAMPIRVVHEDEHLWVIDKPAGLVVHPAPGHWSGTLLNGLLAFDARSAQLPRAGIVHRLDRDTSGLMLVARSRQAMDALVALIAARDVTRQYVALAHRAWQGASSRHVDAPIGRDPRNRLRMAVVDLARHSGKEARTTIALLDGNDEVCLVRCTLETGRTHQIRVHMASIGHPLLADALYGGAPAAGMARQALHAYRLAFVHPITGTPLELRCEPPPDLRAAIDALGLDYNRA